MKKVVIPVIAALFIVSIVLVAFLGTIPSSEEDTIYCDYIVSNLQSKSQPSGDKIYEVIKKECPYEYGTKEYEEWSKNNDSYQINIHDFKYVYDYLGKTINLDCVAKTLKEGKKITNPKLNYTYHESYPETRATINSVGDVTFTQYTTTLSEMQGYTFIVTSDDAHNATIRIKMIARPYNY